MTAPKWSVVVPTHGHRETLAQCLAALRRLDPPAGGFEVIVADDSATGSLALADDDEIRVVRVGGRGPSAARNAGAAVARGRWLAFTDDDCAPEPGWLLGFEQAPAYPNQKALGGTVRNAIRENVLSAASQAVLDACHAHFNATGPRFYASSNIATPAEDYRAIGGFDESLAHAEDRAFWDSWRASGRGVGSAPRAIVWHHRTHTVRDLWHQHAGYGRGALAVHRRRGTEPQPDLGFYVRLARRALAEPVRRRPAVLALAALTQVATIAGYLSAGRRAERDRARQPGSQVAGPDAR